MRQKLLAFLVMTVLLLGAAGTSQAILSAVDQGPYTAATGFFPQWYEDTNGRGLDLCLSTAPSPTGLGPMCTLLPDPGFNPALPIVFPVPPATGNFPSESFYFAADANISFSGGLGTLRYVAALEAAFATGSVVDGQQVTFARIRIIGNVNTAGSWIVTHPYGEEVFEVAAGGTRSIAFTRDVGFATGNFTGALAGDIGPFLVASTGLITVGTETFIGDPNAAQPVTGSPFGTNFLRVQGPGVDVTQPLFGLMGKVTAAVLPAPLVVERTTYSSFATSPTTTQTQIDVFAISAPSATLSFDDSATPVVNTPMLGDAFGRFFGQALVPPASLSPVSITAVNPPNTPTTSLPTGLTDVVSITKAEYSLATGTLVIEASSSDETLPPALTDTVFGPLALVGTGPLQRLSVTLPVPAPPAGRIPPASVTVRSSAGGADTEEVIILP